MNARRVIPAAVVLAWAACSAWAQGEWVLIGRDLSERRVELTQIRGGVVSFVDERGRPAEAPVGEVLAMVHERPPADRPPRELPWITRQLEVFGQTEAPRESAPVRFEGVLELTDGQRWVGALASARGESLTWLVEDTVLLSAPLEAVRSAAISAPIGEARDRWDGISDRVVLANGDIVDGFVAAAGPVVRVETAGAAAEAPLEQVTGLLLANPPAPAGGVIVRTERGSVISVSGLEISATGQVSAGVGGKSLDAGLGMRTADLRSIDFAPGAYAGLASIEPALVTAPGGGRSPDVGIVPDDSLGADGLELQGPIRVEWSLPHGAARLAATATLPPAMWAWGDCELVVRSGDGRELLRERLHADRPRVELRAALGGQTGLVIEVESGRGGPVQDRVVLERPLVSWR